jgi:hypothetical protein
MLVYLATCFFSKCKKSLGQLKKKKERNGIEEVLSTLWLLKETFSGSRCRLHYVYSYLAWDIFYVWDSKSMWRVWGRGVVCTGFWWGNLRERDHWGDPDVYGRIILRLIIRKWEGVVGTGWSWLRIGTGGGHLCIR